MHSLFAIKQIFQIKSINNRRDWKKIRKPFKTKILTIRAIKPQRQTQVTQIRFQNKIATKVFKIYCLGMNLSSTLMVFYRQYGILSKIIKIYKHSLKDSYHKMTKKMKKTSKIIFFILKKQIKYYMNQVTKNMKTNLIKIIRVNYPKKLKKMMLKKLSFSKNWSKNLKIMGR